MGKASFCNVQDLQGGIQAYVARDEIGVESYRDFQEDGYRRYRRVSKVKSLLQRQERNLSMQKK